MGLHSYGPSNVEFGTAGAAIHYERAEEFEVMIRPVGEVLSHCLVATGVRKPCFDVRPIPQEIFSDHEHLTEYREYVYTDGGVVDLLIGLEYAPLIIPEKIVRDQSFPDNSPSVAVTRLGCYVYGGLNKCPHRTPNN